MTNHEISILAVEDEIINQMVLKSFFKTLGIRAEVVSSGGAALSAIEKRHAEFDLVFMDLGLPDINGITAVQKIRQFEAQHDLEPLYICALTASDSQEKQQECLTSGMNVFMTKPITMDQINHILQSFNMSLA